MTHKELKTRRNLPENELNGKQTPLRIYIEEKSEHRKKVIRRSFFATLAILLMAAVIGIFMNINQTETEPEFTSTTTIVDGSAYMDTAGEAAGPGERIAVPYMENGNVRNRYITIPSHDKLEVPKLDKETKERMEAMRKTAENMEKIRDPKTGRIKIIEGVKPPKIIEVERGRQSADSTGAK
mgnify:FL=1